MRIRNTGPAISGAPAPGEIGEVDDQLGEAMVRRGFAQRIETLSDRLGIDPVTDDGFDDTQFDFAEKPWNVVGWTDDDAEPPGS